MMKEFKDLLLKKAKEGKFLSEDQKSAKMETLMGIKEMMGEMMADDLKKTKGMKKVTIASPTTEGLIAGIDKAEEVVEGESEESEDESEDEMPMMDKPEMKMAGMSKEEKIKKLEEELAALKSESEEAMA